MVSYNSPTKCCTTLNNFYKYSNILSKRGNIISFKTLYKTVSNSDTETTLLASLHMIQCSTRKTTLGVIVEHGWDAGDGSGKVLSVYLSLVLLKNGKCLGNATGWVATNNIIILIIIRISKLASFRCSHNKCLLLHRVNNNGAYL